MNENSQKQEIQGNTTLSQDVKRLVIKIICVVVAGGLIFTFVFGVYRYADPGMKPAIRDGDLLVVYRVDKRYSAMDVTLFEYQGRLLAGRVVAVAGDTVDIGPQGLMVNGAYQQEDSIYEETTQFTGGVTFPLTVGDGQIFVLGDNRTHATDSRIMGCINVADTKGKIIGLIRRRSV